MGFNHTYKSYSYWNKAPRLLKTFKMITIKVTEIIEIPTQLGKVELPLLTYQQISTLDFVIQTLLHRILHQPSHQ